MQEGSRCLCEFQSTPPARRATNLLRSVVKFFVVSIHAPRAEGDDIGRQVLGDRLVSIHAPRAEGDPACYK